MKRVELLLLLARMNDEAFAYVALAMQKSAMTGGALTQIWPDGLGGFTDRDIIEAARKAADDYLKEIS